MLELLDSTMSISFVRATATKQLWKRPGFLFSAHMVSGAGGAGTATLYDGHTTNGDVKVDLSAPTSSADDRTFTPPIYFDQGIYLSVGSNVTSVIVQIRHAKDVSVTKKKRSKK